MEYVCYVGSNPEIKNVADSSYRSTDTLKPKPLSYRRQTLVVVLPMIVGLTLDVNSLRIWC